MTPETSHLLLERFLCTISVGWTFSRQNGLNEPRTPRKSLGLMVLLTWHASTLEVRWVVSRRQTYIRANHVFVTGVLHCAICFLALLIMRSKQNIIGKLPVIRGLFCTTCATSFQAHQEMTRRALSMDAKCVLWTRGRWDGPVTCNELGSGVARTSWGGGSWRKVPCERCLRHASFWYTSPVQIPVDCPIIIPIK